MEKRRNRLKVFAWTVLLSVGFFSGAYARTSPRQQADSLIDLIEKNYYSNGSYTIRLLEELMAIADRTQNTDILSEAIYYETLTEYSQYSNYSPHAKDIERLLASESLSDRNRLLLLYSSALMHLSNGQYLEAFKKGVEAYHLAVEAKDTSLILKTATSLGNIGPYIQDYDLSDHYYRIALRYTSPQSVEYLKLMLNRSRLKYLIQDYDSAVRMCRAVLPQIEQGQDTAFWSVALLNLGSYYKMLGKADTSFRFYRKALRLMEGADNNNIRLILYGNIGNYYREKKNFDSARYYYRQAQHLSLADSNLSQLASVSYDLSILFTAMGNIDSAYYFLNEYNVLTEKNQQPQTIESYKSYVEMVRELSGNKIQISEQRLALRKKQMTVIAITASGLIIIVVLFLLFSIERRRSMRQSLLLKEVENRELSDQLEHEQEIKKLQEEQMEQKVRELTSYSLLLANKNNLLNNLRGILQEKQSPDTEKALRIIEESLHTDGDYWKQFVLHFNRVDPLFFEHLQHRFAGLTSNEIKLCAYIRLGMSSKQISQMLNLSPDSVNKNRYRLRKKFDMEKEEDLDSFIRSI